METGNGVTPYVLSETCWMTGAGANRMAYGEGFLKKPRPGVTPRIGGREDGDGQMIQKE